jgi:hypothetical protein
MSIKKAPVSRSPFVLYFDQLFFYTYTLFVSTQTNFGLSACQRCRTANNFCKLGGNGCLPCLVVRQFKRL